MLGQINYDLQMNLLTVMWSCSACVLDTVLCCDMKSIFLEKMSKFIQKLSL